MSSFGLSEALPAGDVWEGSWKFEIGRYSWLGYYDTSGKTVFRIGCGMHFEMEAVYPGASPKQDETEASITIANGKTQMDFAGLIWPSADPDSGFFPICRFSTSRTSAIPSLTKINGTRWKIASSIFWALGSR